MSTATCDLCGCRPAVYDASTLGELLMGDELSVCTECLNQIESAIRQAWRHKINEGEKMDEEK